MSVYRKQERWVAACPTNCAVVWCGVVRWSRQAGRRLEGNGSVLRHRPGTCKLRGRCWTPPACTSVTLHTFPDTGFSHTTDTDVFDRHSIGLLLQTEACKVHKKRSIQTQACCESKWHSFFPSSTLTAIHLHELLVSHNRVSRFSPHTKCKHGSLAQPWPSAVERCNSIRPPKKQLGNNTAIEGRKKEKKEENGTIYKERFMRL